MNDATKVVLKRTEAGNMLLSAVQRFYAERKMVDVRIMQDERVSGCARTHVRVCTGAGRMP
jgi:hypothetical protein